MTVFMNFRAQAVGGSTTNPTFLEGGVNGVKSLTGAQFVSLTKNRDVLFATHGFNVSRSEGICALDRLEEVLSLPPSCLFVGVLWPGDFWLPVINYPFEGNTAAHCGRLLASMCNRELAQAASLSFVTHSLGARLALEAAKTLQRKVRSVCLTAAAVNDDCLTSEYAAAFANSSIVSVLASRKDLVLKLAFPIGDPIADILNFDHKPFAAALGYRGPQQAVGATVPPWQIPDADGYDHGDYLPPSGLTAKFPDPLGKWNKTAGYMRAAFMGTQQLWPR